MLNELDDLFRQQLGPHATPPGADLQRRLAELAAAERLDTRFRAGLGSHASPPRRALWERLEDEHLHPPVRRRRVAAWWQYSAAAVLLLLLLAGGAGLWRGYVGQGNAGGVAAGESAGAVKPEHQGGVGSSVPSAVGGSVAQLQQAAQSIEQQVLITKSIDLSEKNKKKAVVRATATALSPSSSSIVTATQPRRPAPARQLPGSLPIKPQRPDAAAGELATTSRRKAPAGRPEPAANQPTVAAATPTAPALAATTAPMGLVEVEVRRGPEAARPAPTPASAVAAAEPRPERRPRLRLGGLLRQADRLAHGESVSLADATGPAESLTVQARIGGRLLSKTIRL